MQYWIWLWNTASESGGALCNALKAKAIRHEGSVYKGSLKKTVINWGASSIANTEVMKSFILNHPSVVGTWTNKAMAFKAMTDLELSCPPWTDDPAVAAEWCESGKTLFARTSLTGHSGKGIVEMRGDNIPEWPKGCRLFTEYVPKKDEYRVHFFKGKIIDIQKKSLKTSTDVPVDPKDVNWKIRNLSNGFVFTRGNIGDLPKDVTSVANLFIERVPLDFGAIDIIYNEKRNRAYILEVNTAPGLTGTTLEKYAEAFNSYEM